MVTICISGTFVECHTGSTAWTPLDSKGMQCLRELVADNVQDFTHDNSRLMGRRCLRMAVVNRLVLGLVGSVRGPRLQIRLQCGGLLDEYWMIADEVLVVICRKMMSIDWKEMMLFFHSSLIRLYI